MVWAANCAPPEGGLWAGLLLPGPLYVETVVGRPALRAFQERTARLPPS